MLSGLRNTRGGPSLRIRILAALVVVAMVGLTAPVVLVPMVRWLAETVLGFLS